MGLFNLFRKTAVIENDETFKRESRRMERQTLEEQNSSGKPVKSFCLSLRYDRFADIRNCMEYDKPIGYSGRSDMRTFYMEARHITYAFEKNLTDVCHDMVERVNIYAVKQLSNRELPKDGHWVYFDAELDYEEYLKQNDRLKSEMIMMTFMKGIEEAVVYYGWDFEPFLNVKDMLEANDYCHKWTIQKKIVHGSKMYYARTFVEHSLRSFDVFVELFDRNGNSLCEKKVISEKPDDILFDRLLGKAKWNDSELIFYEKNTKEFAAYAKVDFADIMEQ